MNRRIIYRGLFVQRQYVEGQWVWTITRNTGEVLHDAPTEEAAFDWIDSYKRRKHHG